MRVDYVDFEELFDDYDAKPISDNKFEAFETKNKNKVANVGSRCLPDMYEFEKYLAKRGYTGIIDPDAHQIFIDFIDKSISEKYCRNSKCNETSCEFIMVEELQQS